MQHLVDHHQVGALVRQAGGEDVAVAQLAPPQARLGHPVAGEVQHLLRKVETQRRLRVRPEQRQHPTGAGAQVHQSAERSGPGRLQDGVHQGL